MGFLLIIILPLQSWVRLEAFKTKSQKFEKIVSPYTRFVYHIMQVEW